MCASFFFQLEMEFLSRAKQTFSQSVSEAESDHKHLIHPSTNCQLPFPNDQRASLVNYSATTAWCYHIINGIVVSFAADSFLAFMAVKSSFSLSMFTWFRTQDGNKVLRSRHVPLSFLVSFFYSNHIKMTQQTSMISTANKLMLEWWLIDADSISNALAE